MSFSCKREFRANMFYGFLRKQESIMLVDTSTTKHENMFCEKSALVRTTWQSPRISEGLLRFARKTRELFS